ncbi:hypothetical protein Asulf_01322 [Archaeoglobus sulfaticallidus PM70-1]|uniref:Uncharacterized protein n=1 Tax=Archaeoglobus sulfaticallidus PM70-1 TaxID=387631 RepID=N0BE67_9EURY|nr:hypothetical protein [Archaeoglobus sulfaticallidus]AGK61313.1 hypothetical protein Asulf_01322 [Archaeoglobus sulfaticallidus PM70-1]
MDAPVRNGDIEKLLQVCSPSRLDSLVRKICPGYKADRSAPSLLYEEIHNMAVVMILTRLRAAGIEAEGEIAIEYGVVDIVVKYRGEIIAVVEVKTGKVKLIQSAVYAHITGKPVFIVETKSGRVTKLTPDVATRLVELFIGVLKDIKEVRGDKVIPNPGCRYCTANCSYGNGRNLKGADPVRNMLKMLDNINVVVDRLIEGLRMEMERIDRGRQDMKERNN